MLTKLLFRVLILIACLLPVSLVCKSQDLLRNYDLSNIKVDNLTDQQVYKFKQQLDASGFTEDQAEQIALSKGMPLTEIQKLRVRLQQVTANPPQQNSSTQQNPLTNKQLLTDTSGNQYLNTTDTTPRTPIINPRIFGAELFNNASLNFQPSIPVATPLNYNVGPGDQLNINVYGVQEITIPVTVAPEGNIIIPNAGQIQVSGLSIEDATKQISNLMSRTAYPTLKSGSSKLSISVGQIKSISVTVIGANRPGNYTVPSLATTFNALFIAGGPSEYGTFRQIELIRDNKLYKTIDLYSFLTKGDGSDNITLKNNDVIRIPSYKTRVIIDGYIKRPGIFEMLPGETLQDLLTFCSGFTDSAYKASVKIIKFTDRDRSVKDVSAAQFANYTMEPGDSVIVGKTLNRFTNRLSITGAVYRQGMFELDSAMTVRDLINAADGLREDAFMQRAQIFRLKNNLTKEVISFNPTDSAEEKSLLLRREDSVVITSIFDLKDQYYVSVLGEIRNPGYYDYRDSLTLKDLILQAGGFTDAAFPEKIEVARLIRRDTLTAQDTRASLIIDVNGLDDLSSAKKNIALQPSDLVTIRRKPGYLAFQTVTISGQFQYPGPYVLDKRAEHVTDLIQRAGGFTPEAYVDGAYIKRYNLDEKSNEVKQQTISNLQQQLPGSVLGDSAVNVSTNNDTPKQYDQIPLNIQKLLSDPSSPENIVLMPGDELIVPKFNAEVKISGSVLFPTLIPFNKSYSIRDYISSAGGFSQNGKRNKVYVIYANGKAATNRGFLFFKSRPAIKPGTEIIVPAKEERRKLTTTEFIGFSSGLASLAGLIIAILRL